MADKIIYQLQDLKKYFGQREVLKGITLSFLEVVTHFSEPYWILLGTAAGQAIWWADTGYGNLKVLDRTADGPLESKALDGLVATQELLVRDG